MSSHIEIYTIVKHIRSYLHSMKLLKQPDLYGAGQSLTAIFLLTLTLFLGSMNNSESADYEKGLTAYDSGDYATALREWQPLAEQGHANAQFYLGSMYGLGLGVSEDYKVAVKWFTLAAKQGDIDSQSMLGSMYREGLGVPQDDVYAHMWYNIAASSGSEVASETASKFRANIEKRMTPADISAAQKRASECIRNQYKDC